MTREESLAKLRLIQDDPEQDAEGQHMAADDVLCDLLSAIGYQDVVDEWNKVPRWYS